MARCGRKLIGAMVGRPPISPRNPTEILVYTSEYAQRMRPESTASANALVVEAIRSVLRHETGLTDSVVPVASRSPGEIDDGVVHIARQHRVLATVAPHADDLGFTPRTSAELRGAWQASRLEAMATVAETAFVSATLAAAGIQHLIMKGAPVSVLTTGSALNRTSMDVDVLIEHQFLNDAVRALEGAGLTRYPFSVALDSPLRRYAQRTQPELLLLHGGRQVDIHWRLDKTRTTLNWPFEQLVAESVAVELAGQRVPALGRCQAAIVNAANGAKDDWCLIRTVVDQVRLMEGLDPTAAMEEARRVGARRRLGLAMALTDRLLGLDPGGQLTVTRHVADSVWSQWVGSPNRRGRGPRLDSVGRFADHVLTFDTPREAGERLETLVWPVEAMALRTLGDAGDRHPWLYAVAAPVLLPKRLSARGRRRL